jgi:hypothetical protein
VGDAELYLAGGVAVAGTGEGEPVFGGGGDQGVDLGGDLLVQGDATDPREGHVARAAVVGVAAGGLGGGAVLGDWLGGGAGPRRRR